MFGGPFPILPPLPAPGPRGRCAWVRAPEGSGLPRLLLRRQPRRTLGGGGRSDPLSRPETDPARWRAGLRPLSPHPPPGLRAAARSGHHLRDRCRVARHHPHCPRRQSGRRMQVAPDRNAVGSVPRPAGSGRISLRYLCVPAAASASLPRPTVSTSARRTRPRSPATADRNILLVSSPSAAVERTIAMARTEPSLVRFRWDGKQLIAGSQSERLLSIFDVAAARSTVRLPFAMEPRTSVSMPTVASSSSPATEWTQWSSSTHTRTEVDQTMLAGRAPGADDRHRHRPPTCWWQIPTPTPSRCSTIETRERSWSAWCRWARSRGPSGDTRRASMRWCSTKNPATSRSSAFSRCPGRRTDRRAAIKSAPLVYADPGG